MTHFLLSLRRYAAAWEVNRQSTGTGRRVARRPVNDVTDVVPSVDRAIVEFYVRMYTTCLTYVA